MPVEDDDPRLPARLAADLSVLYRCDISIPKETHDEITSLAHQHFARRRSHRLIIRIGALVTAAAAIVLVAIHFASPPQSPPAQFAMTSTGVNIVDALRVARDIKQGRPDQARDDFNHDGRVDRADIDAIAMAAVKLPEVGVQ